MQRNISQVNVFWYFNNNNPKGSNCAGEQLSASCQNRDANLFSRGAASSGDMTGCAAQTHLIHCNSSKADAKYGVAEFSAFDKAVFSSTWKKAKLD